jgi:hypothetical protein
VFWTVEALSPLTLLIDEADSFLPEAEELREVLNSGYERSGQVIRVVETQGQHQPIMFRTFAPLALAAIGTLPPTLEDRALPVRLQRKGAGETVEKFRENDNRGKMDILARKLARCTVDLRGGLKANPAMPAALGDREADISVPLVSIADLAGGEWPERGRRALLAVFGRRAEMDGNSDKRGEAARRPPNHLRRGWGLAPDQRRTLRQTWGDGGSALAGVKERKGDDTFPTRQCPPALPGAPGQHQNV